MPILNRLIIMVKEPYLGRVKSRLARDIGAVQATRFYRATTATILRRLARDSRWQTMLAVAPDTAVDAAAWPVHIPRLAQGRGDIGERMARALASEGHAAARAVLIGSDIPGITAAHIAAAFRCLRRNDFVFGPAEDGGFWLVGVRRPCDARALFTDVRWSSQHTLADTLAGLSGRKTGFAARLTDVDDAASLHATSRRPLIT